MHWWQGKYRGIENTLVIWKVRNKILQGDLALNRPNTGYLNGVRTKLINLPGPVNYLWQNGGLECWINVFLDKSGFTNLAIANQIIKSL